MNVSRPSVQRARVVLDSAEPEVVKLVEEGKLAVSAAVAVAKQIQNLPPAGRSVVIITPRLPRLPRRRYFRADQRLHVVVFAAEDEQIVDGGFQPLDQPRRHERLEHGHWLPWLDGEFGWADRTAERFIQVYELVKSDKLSNLPSFDVSALYLLAAPSTPEQGGRVGYAGDSGR